MWIFIWAILSLFIMSVSIWSYMILRQQKNAWASFAKKHNLEFTKGKLMEPPFMRGAINGRTVVFFTGQQQTDDARGVRMVTIIEFDMHCGLPVPGAIGSKETAAFLASLRMEHTYLPENPEENWSAAYVTRTREPKILASYMTPTRRAAVHALLSMKNCVALWIFDERDCVFRIETNDPLRDPAKLDKILNRIMGELDKLVPDSTEKEKAEKARIAREAAEAAMKPEEQPAEPVAAVPVAPPPAAAKPEPYLEPLPEAQEEVKPVRNGPPLKDKPVKSGPPLKGKK